MNFRSAANLCLFTLLIAGCAANETNPPRSATEQMLISTAADRAADQLALSIPARTPVFVDATNFEGYDSKYAIGAIRTSLLKQGAYLVDDKKQARVIVEVRAGALSTDKKDTLIGTPSFTVPVPFTSGGLPVPEIALYKSATQQGVAKFALTSYEAKSGKLVTAVEPKYGIANNTKRTVLLFFSWTENDAVPEESKDIVEQRMNRLTKSTGDTP